MEIEEEQKKIIEKDLKEKVIINAPPGSGKTETIIQKLAYICKNDLAAPKDILVICFSRAAVKEIKQRVEKIIGIRNKIDIRTIDSFCSWVIREIEDNYKEQFFKMNYEERIKHVISLLEKENRLRIQVKYLKHIIIDEFQDIVGVRVKFILKLLEVHERGFTILGDEYQAIFNYQSDKLTSDYLIEEIYKKHPACKLIEFKEQHRESNLKQRAKNNFFRILIKKYKNNPEKLNDWTEKMLKSIQDKKLENIENKKVAILTRQNGEVFEIIKTLDEKIPYQIQQYNNIITFPAWIGYTLFDYDRTYITKEKFKKIIQEKIGEEDTEKYWQYCKAIENLDKIYNENEYELNLPVFKENIIIDKGVYPENFEKENNSLIISTIHKSKGREYDEVYIHFKEKDFIQKKKPELALDNARVLYVALTRAKNQYYKYEKEIKNIFFESFKDGSQDRYYGFWYKRKYKSFKIIKKIEIGLDGDVDNNSFIDENIVGNVEQCQKYIYNNVKKGDTVDLIRDGDKFYIYHKNRKIGMANIENIFNKVIYNANRWRYYEKEVVAYRGVNIKNIITIAKFPDFIEDKYASPYKDTGLWIGIELEGFGKIEFEG